ncbi:Murein hydrolase activator NlpD [Thalassocella blandensis]|nr:Murein hydrolase activator NlpD [Thalassocella blandensis]
MERAIEKFARQLSIILITLMGVISCGSPNYYAPVDDKSQPPSERITTHVVSRGETLYSIAWRYNLDYRKLAASNQLGSSYTIYPGQVLQLSEKQATSRPVSNSPRKVASATPKPKPAKSARSKNKTPVEPEPPALIPEQKDEKWVWPSEGKLISTFYSNNGLNKGVDIQGKLEQPVIAASSGTVVYSGQGLRGYGKLIIVKHSEKYLSAYAHNHNLLVKEGEKVEIGQKIAEMGSSGTDSVKLHFEIRYDGKPVDPLKYLPRR